MLSELARPVEIFIVLWTKRGTIHRILAFQSEAVSWIHTVGRSKKGIIRPPDDALPGLAGGLWPMEIEIFIGQRIFSDRNPDFS